MFPSKEAAIQTLHTGFLNDIKQRYNLVDRASVTLLEGEQTFRMLFDRNLIPGGILKLSVLVDGGDMSVIPGSRDIPNGLLIRLYQEIEREMAAHQRAMEDDEPLASLRKRLNTGSWK